MDTPKEKLENMNYPDFEKDFIKKIDGLSREEMAFMVWLYGNAQYNKGFNQGYYDPDFDEED